MHELCDPVTTYTLFKKSEMTQTRGHKFKLEKTDINTRKVQMFFTNRIINTWSDLPAVAVTASTINAFKNCVDRLFKGIIHNTKIDVFNL